MDDHSEILANLVAITGCDDAAALNLLEACDWKLEDAVSLHFAAGDGHATGTQISSRSLDLCAPLPDLHAQLDPAHGKRERACMHACMASQEERQEAVGPPGI